MTSLRDLLETAVEGGTVPGAAALVAHGEDVEIAGAGEVGPESIVRIASVTKPITAAAVMLLGDEGVVLLDDPIAPWLAELASPGVVRIPASGRHHTVDPISRRSKPAFGRSRRSSRRAAAASSRRSPTCAASGECCSQTAAGFCRLGRCAR